MIRSETALCWTCSLRHKVEGSIREWAHQHVRDNPGHEVAFTDEAVEKEWEQRKCAKDSI